MPLIGAVAAAMRKFNLKKKILFFKTLDFDGYIIRIELKRVDPDQNVEITLFTPIFHCGLSHHLHQI